MKFIGDRRGDRRPGLGNPAGAQPIPPEFFTTDCTDDTDSEFRTLLLKVTKGTKDETNLGLFVTFANFCSILGPGAAVVSIRVESAQSAGKILRPEFGCGPAASG
jgi:hypothetical protein